MAAKFIGTNIIVATRNSGMYTSAGRITAIRSTCIIVIAAYISVSTTDLWAAGVMCAVITIITVNRSKYTSSRRVA